ncbi:MAG: hypothetical protein KC588_18410 [Nitrospira sp.]|nr:hypothetical protein [Nitrospira sp.]
MSQDKDPNAVALGRKGGLKGGPARAAKLTPQERRESARNAAIARWKNKEEEGGPQKSENSPPST